MLVQMEHEKIERHLIQDFWKVKSTVVVHVEEHDKSIYIQKIQNQSPSN